MNFYTQQHKPYCGIDLHARAMYVCILDEHGTKLEHQHGKATALTVLAHKLGRAVYDLLTREQAFDLTRFVTASPLRGETVPAV